MAYEKARELLDLAIALAGSHYGLNISEIEARLADKSGKRPSPQALERQRQRMMIQLEGLFGAALEITIDEENRRSWRLRTKDLANMPLVDPADLAALERAGDMLAKRNDKDGAERLTRIQNGLQMALDTRKRPGIEVDFEALRDAQAVVAQPGPHIQIDASIERAVSEAILRGSCLEFEYQGAGGSLIRKSVEPVGVLLGPRKYLVARSANSPAWADANHWRMDRIVNPLVSDAPARAMPNGFKLAEHARRCFGVFWNEREYQDVEWRFAPRAADSASKWRFHPDQTLEHNVDGSVTVRFKASGHYEMAWHLYQWGDAVEVFAPKAVADLVRDYRRNDFTVLP